MAVNRAYYGRYVPTAREIKAELQSWRTSKVKATLADIQTVIDDNFVPEFMEYIAPNEDFDFSSSKKTKLYNEHGGEYCTLLEILYPYKKDYYDWYR